MWVGEGDEDFKGGSWVSAVDFVNANGGGIVNACLGDIENYVKNGKLGQAVEIIKYCTLNSLGDLIVTLKDLSEEEMAELELQVCGNVTNQEDQYKLDEEVLNLALEEEARTTREWLEKYRQEQEIDRYTAFSQGFLDFLFLGAEVGALGSLGALKPSTHPVMAIFQYPIRAEVEVACALEVEMEATCLVGALAVEVEATYLVRALDLVEVEATCLVGALDLVGLSLNIIILASVSGYLTSLNKTRSSSPKTPSSLKTSPSLDI
ncbi:hypothetical protein Tco_0654080 [Tanacetum coccineum]|uniref:Uncharacterized protein n=1 Tax=Tanacetum coccineum TaxID=301880 RepID=A0ABQ4X370_9ASTR